MVHFSVVLVVVRLEVYCLGRAWALQYPHSLLLILVELLASTSSIVGRPELLASICWSTSSLVTTFLATTAAVPKPDKLLVSKARCPCSTVQVADDRPLTLPLHLSFSLCCMVFIQVLI